MTKFTNLICKSKTYIALGIAFGIVSCDNEFDLSDINTDMNVGGSIAVPIGFGLSTIYSVYFLLTDRLHIIKRKPKPEEDSGYQVEGGNF